MKTQILQPQMNADQRRWEQRERNLRGRIFLCWFILGFVAGAACVLVMAAVYFAEAAR
jgi:hypothetical protein